ncbi:hypothetical protein ANO11243_029450 [Dothideomycetidae sp. 11243]|nr:hypothetical protein ANO11243_029450 [fungal sp. No.11243]
MLFLGRLAWSKNFPAAAAGSLRRRCESSATAQLGIGLLNGVKGTCRKAGRGGGLGGAVACEFSGSEGSEGSEAETSQNPVAREKVGRAPDKN